MKRTLSIALVVAWTMPLVACGHSHKKSNGSSATTGAVTSGDPTLGLPGLPGGGMSGNGGLGAAVTAITPSVGSPYGGDAVTLTGSGFVSGATVAFDGVAATDVVVASATSITCKTPAHAAGLVDVTVTQPGNVVLRLNNAFTFDPNAGPMARVADYGDPSGEEQELLELMQRARRDPAAEAARLNQAYGLSLNFSGYVARPPLSHNGFLHDAAEFHNKDMDARGYYGHVDPDGVNANGRILATPYALNDYFGTNTTINLTENIGKGTGAAPGNKLTTAQGVHDAYMIDENVVGTKHRQMILGNAQFGTDREVGISYLHIAPSDYIDEEFAFTRTNKPFLLGVAFDDRNGDGVCQNGEGTPGTTVTLSHASGFSISTTTKSAGGFSFEVFVPGTYTLTINGKSTQVTIGADNVKVDLQSGQLRTY
jgi:hypothetical protein